MIKAVRGQFLWGPCDHMILKMTWALNELATNTRTNPTGMSSKIEQLSGD